MSHSYQFTCQDCKADTLVAMQIDNKPLCWICRFIRLNPDMPAGLQAGLRRKEPHDDRAYLSEPFAEGRSSRVSSARMADT